MDTQLVSKVRRKIAGWYTVPGQLDKAVARIMAQRDEIVELLRSTGREGIENVIQYLDDSGFYYRASSANGHHNFPGGLAEHSLGTFRIAEKNASPEVPRDSVIIAALLHDICKSDRFWFRGRTINKHRQTGIGRLHSARSIAILRDCGVKLTTAERRAIRWHMGKLKRYIRNEAAAADRAQALKEPLWHAVYFADKEDASHHPAQRH